jgi:hypothetical protein
MEFEMSSNLKIAPWSKTLFSGSDKMVAARGRKRFKAF